MNCTDCIENLDAYVDDVLAPAIRREVELHVNACAACRAHLGSLRTLLAQTRALPHEISPQTDLWSGISPHLTAPGSRAFAPLDSPAPGVTVACERWAGRSRISPLRWIAPLGIAAAVAFLGTIAERTIVPRTETAWSVAAVAGAPRIGAEPIRDEATFRLGQWLETDAESRAKVAVGSIGEVNVEPNSRLRLIGVRATDHRLELARGTMNAFIWAPPRLFFVDTPSATAVDLGCAYTLTVDDAGNGELHVVSGYVALADGERESIIRSGMRCLTRRGVGPGTPFADDASDALRAALRRFDFDLGAATAALPEVLALVDADDVVTLWHLLARATRQQRGLVFDALARHAPPPAGVTRDGIVAGSASMRRIWAEALGLERL